MPNVPVQAPTGNALTDALAVDPQAAADAVNAANTSAANVASDCLWPPSGQFSVPIIPGLYTQSFQIPCLVTYSEARALVAVGLIGVGLLTIQFGVVLMAAVAVAPTVLSAVGFGSKAAIAGKVLKRTKSSPAPGPKGKPAAAPKAAKSSPAPGPKGAGTNRNRGLAKPAAAPKAAGTATPAMVGGRRGP